MAYTDNAKYVKRGAMLAVSEDPGWGQQLREANRRKNGAPFRYAEALFASLAVTRSMVQVPYRQLAGLASEMVPGIPMPSHATIHRRIRGLRVQTIDGMVAVSAADGSRMLLTPAPDTFHEKIAPVNLPVLK